MSTEPQSALGVPSLTYDEVQTGYTVHAATMTRIAQLGSLLASARPAKRVQIHSAYPNGAAARVYSVSYTRSSDAVKHLYLAAHYRAETFGDTLTIDLTIRDAAGHSVASSSDLIPGGFKVGQVYYLRARTGQLAVDVQTLAEGYLDLDALGATLTDPDWSLEFAIAAPSGSSSLIDLIEGWETPRGVVDEDDTYGSLTGSQMAGRPITAGPVVSPSDDGVARLRQTLCGARLSQRTYLQECVAPDDTTAALLPQTASAGYAALTHLEESAGVPIPYLVRVRPVTGATDETARIRFRYLCTGGGTGSLRVITGSASSPFDLAGLTSASWAWSPWLAVQLKAGGTGHVDTVQLKGKTTAGVLYVSGWTLDENVS